MWCQGCVLHRRNLLKDIAEVFCLEKKQVKQDYDNVFIFNLKVQEREQIHSLEKM